MLDYFLIALLILSGISLIIVEIIFVPGTTIVGILGFGMAGYGIFRAYELFGTSTGHVVLFSSVILAIIVIFYSFKSGAWKKFALQESIDATVNENLVDGLEIGQEGVSVSSLKPIGKADFNDQEFEVSSLGAFVEEKTALKIVKIERNKIFIEPLK
jgi:membrane-bound ClpP family serine protease